MTWVVFLFNLLMLAWVVIYATEVAHQAAACSGAYQQDCQAGTTIGAGIGTSLLILLWAAGDVILGVLWLVTKPRGVRDCPVCGYAVRRGYTICGNCDYDFYTGQIADDVEHEPATYPQSPGD